MAILNGKFHILHVSVMIFKSMADAHKLVIDIRHNFLKMRNFLWCTNTGNIFALGIQKKFTHQMILTGGRITGKGDTRTGCLSHIAESHHLDIDCCSP